MDFYFSSTLEKMLLKMLEPSLGRMSILMETFLMLERRLSLLMKLIWVEIVLIILLGLMKEIDDKKNDIE